MKSISGKRLCKTFERHGWILQHISGSHHIYTLSAYPAILAVHGNRNLKTGTLRKLMKESNLTEQDL